MGPNISDWPEIAPLKRHLLLKTAGVYSGSVTTDELVPSGEASSYRSNPEKLSDFTMMSRDPDYVPKARTIRTKARSINSGSGDVSFGSVIVSDQIGDGSSREQAASCQKVLGGAANLTREFSTKRYRSNCINWGLLPLRTEEPLNLSDGSWLFVSDILECLRSGASEVRVLVLDFPSDADPHDVVALLRQPEGIAKRTRRSILCTLDTLTKTEREVLSAGCLINYYRNKAATRK